MSSLLEVHTRAATQVAFAATNRSSSMQKGAV